ncbi:MAG TPA: sigma 54-interacting transcriptional regulator [Patescibacteria group bacterium]|nr:sigma 54-interacting transcriptional regulator [Patescibacteria group bacterium]
MSHLQKIQAAVQQVADAISSVLEMDVTIFDGQMVRIAGTGYHKASIGERVEGYSVGRQVIESGREYVVSDVEQDRACGVCDKRIDCLERAQLCCPILWGKEVIGVISLIAFSPAQQQMLVDRQERLLDFIRRMAELLAVKAAEAHTVARLLFMKNQMETVLNFVTEGIIAIDAGVRVINVNFAAERMLQVNGRDVAGFHLNEVFPGTPIAEVLKSGKGFTDREVKVWSNGRQHHYFVNATPMMVAGEVAGVVASFRTARSWRPAETGTAALVRLTDLVGDSRALAQAQEEARKAAGSDVTVLLLGESGTGKELFARAIHGESRRREGPFVAINCAAIPENLLESELFGYEEGSFTGAQKGGKPGKFQIAHGGTLFLDEIADMPLPLQAKMLRALQDKTVDRLGGVRPQPVDVRIIAATNRELEELVRSGRFREDLYYRLHVFVLPLPALRQRRQDIAPLAEYFLRRHAEAAGRAGLCLTPAALAVLQSYEWPGNVRELDNALACAVVKAAGQGIDTGDLPEKLLKQEVSLRVSSADEETEHRSVMQALERYGESVEGKKMAADSLGISIATFYRKLRKWKNLSAD